MQELPSKKIGNDVSGRDEGKVPWFNSSDVAVWTYLTSSLLLLTSLLFLCAPSFLLLLVSTSGEGHVPATSLTPLESFLSTQLGLLAFALSLSLIVSLPSIEPIAARVQNPTSYHPMLYPVAGASALASMISYNSAYSELRTLGLLVSFSSGTMALWGIWVILFACEGHVSKKTGADKHTSSWLFGNVNAASVQKRWWKRNKRNI